jgi:hypothetical protein
VVASLTRVFRVHNLALAQDAVQDAFCRARELGNGHLFSKPAWKR